MPSNAKKKPKSRSNEKSNTQIEWKSSEMARELEIEASTLKTINDVLMHNAK